MKVCFAAATVAILFTSAIAPPASAESITYTLTGNFLGTLDGQGFDVIANFTGIGDTDTYNGTSVELSSLAAVANGVTFKATLPTYVFNNQINGIAGLGQLPSGDFIDLTGLGTLYDVNTALAPATVTFFGGFGQPFTTDNGTALFSSGLNLKFSSLVAAKARFL